MKCNIKAVQIVSMYVCHMTKFLFGMCHKCIKYGKGENNKNILNSVDELVLFFFFLPDFLVDALNVLF